MVARRRHIPHTAALALAVLALAGCASFRGEPKSLIPAKTARAALAGDYAADKVLTAYAALGSEAERAAYRNRVAYVWLAAADAEYDAWVHNLSREMKGSSLGANWAVLVMNGAAVVSGAEAARALAVGSSTVVGGGAAFKKDVLLDQTIAAVIMRAQAERARAATDIRRKLVTSTAAQYPLGDAIWEIGRLNSAASLNRATGEITAQAAAELATAQEEAKTLVALPLPPAEVRTVQYSFSDFVFDEATDEQLKKLRELFGTEDDPKPKVAKIRIVDAYLARAKDKDGVNALTQKLKDITGKEFKL